MRDMGDGSKRGLDYLDKIIANTEAAGDERGSEKSSLVRNAKRRRSKPEDPGRSITKAMRRPPAFQQYAAHDISSADYYRMSLAERGLFDAMRRVCWCDDSISSDPEEIALAVRRPLPEVTEALKSGRVLAHFTLDDADNLISQELADQMAELMERRRRQVEGGRDGARKTNAAKESMVCEQS